MNEMMLNIFDEVLGELGYGDNDLLFVGKDAMVMTALCAPKEGVANGDLAAVVENEYKGQKNNQVIVKVIHLPYNDEGIDYSKAGVKGLVIPPSAFASMKKYITETKANPLDDEKPKVVGEQSCNIFTFRKDGSGKRVVTEVGLTQKLFQIPDDIWEASQEVTLESLVKSYYDMKKNVAAAQNTEQEPNKAKNPWE